MRRLRLMHDWQCWPLWTDDPVGNLDPASLPIDADLAARLNAWAAHYDSLLDRIDPRDTYIDPEFLRALKREALDLRVGKRFFRTEPQRRPISLLRPTPRRR